MNKISSNIGPVVIATNPVSSPSDTIPATLIGTSEGTTHISGSQSLQDQETRKSIEDSSNAILKGLQTSIALKFNEKSDEWYAVIQDMATGEVIKEVPSREVLDLHEKIKQMIGVFLDMRV